MTFWENNQRPDISIVLPCFNSSSEISARVNEFDTALERTRWTYEIILADDGSTDNSPELCVRVAAEKRNRRCLLSKINRGRGRNVSDAFAICSGTYVGFADMDASTSASYLLPLLIALEQNADVAVARRNYKIRIGELPFIFHRLAAHLIYRWLVRRLLGLNHHDTESGFKFFRREAAKALCLVATSPGWFWDTEIIANAHLLGLRVRDCPTLFLRKPGMGSTVNFFKDGFLQGWNLVRFRWLHRGKTFRSMCCQRPL